MCLTNFTKWVACACALLSICAATTTGVKVAAGGRLSAHVQSAPKPVGINFVTAQELKTKLARNEPVTIIDLRATNAYISSNSKIRGAVHVKARRLRSRLYLPPFRDVPRDSEVVTYCACPNDEASIRAVEVLTSAGFKRVRVLKGGWQAWLDAGGQLEPKPQGI